jgi:hypothetical protein
MATMKLTTFIQKLEAARALKSVYMWGCFGHPVKQPIIDAKETQYPTWYTAERVAYFEGLIGDHYFGWDCVNMIKGILWGWTGLETSYTGGAAYNSNGVPDTNANGFFQRCTGKTSDFTGIVVGAILWMEGHVGIYRGNNEAIETTFRWDDGIQVTGVQNLGDRRTKSRKWTQWGICPWIDYTSVAPNPEPEPEPEPEPPYVYPDDYEHPDVPEVEHTVNRMQGFQPLGALILYSCPASDFINGFPPNKDTAGYPIPDGAVCEVKLSEPPQYCDIYRRAFGQWWKYSSDNVISQFDGYPDSIYSYTEFPVQFIAYGFFSNEVKLIAVKEEQYKKYDFPEGHFTLTGKWTDTCNAEIATLTDGRWVNPITVTSGGLTFKNIYRSNRNVWTTKTGTDIFFAKNV